MILTILVAGVLFALAVSNLVLGMKAHRECEKNDVPGRWDLGDRVVEWQVTPRKAESKPRAAGLTRTLKVSMKEVDEDEVDE